MKQTDEYCLIIIFVIGAIIIITRRFWGACIPSVYL